MAITVVGKDADYFLSGHNRNLTKSTLFLTFYEIALSEARIKERIGINQTNEKIMKNETLSVRLGEVINFDVPASIGIHHQDSGISVGGDTPEARMFRESGIYYICPHGRGCSHRDTRENWCPRCREESEYNVSRSPLAAS